LGSVASWKDRKALAAALAALDAFEDGEWGRKFPTVVAAWRRSWDQVIPFFTFPPEIRRVIYTTNAIESVNARVRKIIKTRGHFPMTPRTNSYGSPYATSPPAGATPRTIGRRR
jgi:putative transposase